MTLKFDGVVNQYTTKYLECGDSPVSLLCPKGRQDLRFRAIDEFITRDGITILDYGCGLGHLFSYLSEFEQRLTYVGVDMVSEFVSACTKKFSGQASFKLLPPEQEIPGGFDIVFASGVFNIKYGDPATSKQYVFERMQQLMAASTNVFICDFLSENVDFRQCGAQHFSVSEIAEFCVSRLSRRFVIRHDLRPYEFTLIAFKDDEVAHPASIFRSDVR